MRTTPYVSSIGIASFVIAAVACSPPAEPGLSGEAIAGLQEVQKRFDEIQPPDIADPASIERSEEQLWNAKCDLVRWAIEYDAAGSTIWGDDCETHCWAQWWLCVDECEDEDAFHPFSGSLPGSGSPGTGADAPVAFQKNDDLGHDSDSNDACWKACDEAHDRCMRLCEISLTLKD